MISESQPGPAPDCHAGLEPETAHQHPELHHWRANVGSPVVLDDGPFAAPRLDGIDLLCWNVAIGLGRIPELLDRLRAGIHEQPGTNPARPLIVLIQEAFRRDASLPVDPSAHTGTSIRSADRTDIVQLARQLGFSLRYSPSMRNGADPSDRGNAVLASVRLAHARGLVLPHVRQRRVAVSARIAGHPDITFVTAHLDTHGRPRAGHGAALRADAGRELQDGTDFDARRAPGDRGAGRRGNGRASLGPGAGRVAQAAALAAYLHDLSGSVVLGADLNSAFGVLDPAVRRLVQAGWQPAQRLGAWRHTYHTRVRLLLDHVLFRSPDGRIAGVEVSRIDEARGDRSRTIFGSDHHPLLARIHLG